MIERDENGERGGSIVFITSQSEDFTNPSQGDYAASKAGLRMLMKALPPGWDRMASTATPSVPAMS